MNTLKFKTWIEDKQALVTVVALVSLIFLALSFPFTFLKAKRGRQEKDIAAMKSQLATRNYLIPEEALMETKKNEVQVNRLLTGEWEEMVARVSAFQRADSALSIGHIDFKVALFDVRQRLQRKAGTINVSLPDNLGMGDTVDSDEDSRKLMLHLRTVEKLVDLALDLKIHSFKSITPLPSAQHAPDDKTAFLEEYPVQIEFSGTLKNLCDLLKEITEPRSTFALKHLRIESPPQDISDLLSVNVVISSLVFLKSPAEVPLAARPPAAGRTVPKGH